MKLGVQTYFEKSLDSQQAAKSSCKGSLLYEFFLYHDLLTHGKDFNFIKEVRVRGKKTKEIFLDTSLTLN